MEKHYPTQDALISSNVAAVPENFIPAPDNIENRMTNIFQSGEIEVGRMRVMFGFRFRAGFIGNDAVELDICCGKDAKAYDDIQHKVCTIINHNIEKGREPFYLIPPHSKIKPYFNDKAFCKEVDGLYAAAQYP